MLHFPSPQPCVSILALHTPASRLKFGKLTLWHKERQIREVVTKRRKKEGIKEEDRNLEWASKGKRFIREVKKKKKKRTTLKKSKHSWPLSKTDLNGAGPWLGQNGVEVQDILLGVSELLDIVRPLPNTEVLQIVPNHFRDSVSTVILEEMHSYDLNFSFFYWI